MENINLNTSNAIMSICISSDDMYVFVAKNFWGVYVFNIDNLDSP